MTSATERTIQVAMHGCVFCDTEINDRAAACEGCITREAAEGIEQFRAYLAKWDAWQRWLTARTPPG